MLQFHSAVFEIVILLVFYIYEWIRLYDFELANFLTLTVCIKIQYYWQHILLLIWLFYVLARENLQRITFEIISISKYSSPTSGYLSIPEFPDFPI